jgi:hypothetical protein
MTGEGDGQAWAPSLNGLVFASTENCQPSGAKPTGNPASALNGCSTTWRASRRCTEHGRAVTAKQERRQSTTRPEQSTKQEQSTRFYQPVAQEQKQKLSFTDATGKISSVPDTNRQQLLAGRLLEVVDGTAVVRTNGVWRSRAAIQCREWEDRYIVRWGNRWIVTTARPYLRHGPPASRGHVHV